MKKLYQFIFFLFLTLFVVATHFFIAYALPFPFDKINIIFIYLIFYLIYTESGTVVWLAFATHVFIEIFPSTTFGITLLSSSLSLLFSYWLYQFYITNKKWYGGVLLLSLTLFFYRFLYTLFLFFVNRVRGEEAVLWLPLFQLGFWELSLTSAMFLVLFFIFSRISHNFSRRMNK